MKIGSVDLEKEIMIVAEIGNNHEGDFILAEDLICIAARTGATAVKFQTYTTDKFISPQQSERIDQLNRFQLSYDQFEALSKVAAREGVLFLSTPLDIESVRRLDPFVPAFKIASGDNNFQPLIQAVAETGKPIILSTGLAEFEQIRSVCEFVRSIWHRRGFKQEMALLHCVASYPTPSDQVHLLAMHELQTLGVTVGYSDHTLGIEAAVLSAALGARIIEKHFTIAKDYSSYRDHQLSADPPEFTELVRRVKEVSVLLGNGRKKLQASEMENLQRARRSIVASCDLEVGHVIKWEDLNWVRPGDGLAPGHEAELVGRRLIRSLRKGENYSLADVTVAEKS